jgi:hypothetical protein
MSPATLNLDQPIAPLLAVKTPGLHGERDVGVQLVLGRPGFVGVRNHCLDCFVLVEAPYRKSVEEGDLG